MNAPHIVAVGASPVHSMAKQRVQMVKLIKGLGIEGDAHAGVTVKHRSRVQQDPTQINLRQVHLIHTELFDELLTKGFTVTAGLMGENVTTQGLDVLRLPRGTRLRLGSSAVVEVTGLRNPCKQLDGVAPGLMEAVLERTPDRGLIRKAGIMSIVLESGEVRVGDQIGIELPSGVHEPLKPV